MKKHHAANRADPPCFQVQCISFSINCNDYSPIQSFPGNYFRKMKQQKQKKATELAGIKQRKSKHWMENMRASRVGPRNVNMLKRLIWFKKCKTSNCFKDCYLQGWKHLQGSCLKVLLAQTLLLVLRSCALYLQISPRVWSLLLKKSLMENFIFYAVLNVDWLIYVCRFFR